MSRGLGLGFSVALHAMAIGLLPVVLWRDDLLRALIVDLREDVVPSVASARSPAPETQLHPAPRSSRLLASRHPAPLAESATALVPEVPSPEPAPALAIEPTRDLPRPPAPLASDSAPSANPGADAGARGPASRDSDRGSERGMSLSADPGRAIPGRGEGEADGPGGRSGQALALTAPGGGSGVGPEYGPYLAALRQRIQQSVRYPATARRRGISGTVNVEILILANGAVSDVTVLDSSTHQALDEAALDTIRALPRMPLPPDVPARPLRVHVPIVFQMR